MVDPGPVKVHDGTRQCSFFIFLDHLGFFFFGVTSADSGGGSRPCRSVEYTTVDDVGIQARQLDMSSKNGKHLNDGKMLGGALLNSRKMPDGGRKMPDGAVSSSVMEVETMEKMARDQKKVSFMEASGGKKEAYVNGKATRKDARKDARKRAETESGSFDRIDRDDR